VEKVDYKNGIKAKLKIHVQTPQGPKEKSITVKQGADLFVLSEERANYKAGFEVTEINAEPGREHIRFSSGRTLRLGEEIGGLRQDVWRSQIKETIKRHMESCRFGSQRAKGASRSYRSFLLIASQTTAITMAMGRQ
jgi:type III restriction enzyme